jgi:flagellar biosynthetic protein FliR
MVIAELEIFKLFLVVLARFTGLMVSAPVLGSANFPVQAKIGLSALCAMIVTPVLPALATPLPDAPLAFAFVAAGDFLLGVMIGFVLTLVFSAIQVGGQIIDMQTGFGMMNVFNPAMETQVPIFGFFLFILAVLYMILLGGHRLMIRGLVATFDHVPPGGMTAGADLFWQITAMGRVMFVDGLMIAAPVATAMLLAYLTMGLLGRVVPQIQLFVVGFPITIAAGLFMVAFSIGLYLELLDDMFRRSFWDVDQIIRSLG